MVQGIASLAIVDTPLDLPQRFVWVHMGYHTHVSPPSVKQNMISTDLYYTICIYDVHMKTLTSCFCHFKQYLRRKKERRNKKHKQEQRVDR